MVIINNRDDFLPFLKSPGVRMQTPLVNSVTTTTASLNRDVASQVQQQQQQQQQHQQQQQQQLGNINNNNNNNNNTLINNNNNNSIAGVVGSVQSVVSAGCLNVNNINNNNNNINNNNNGQPQHARALLICRPNSHPFNNRTLYLEPGAQAKVGRSVARIRVSENNAIFDCKVLSRNHAVLWYKDGRFFIKDTGSSNGTFINNIRLSQTCTESEPYEISSGDIVQFGVDVMENTRRETHGCITATLKLFLPDGRETKASQKVGIGGQSAIIPPVDLYRLNQYIQEANQREQILETKLISLQKMVESTRQNSSLGWQAMIDEDRLLSRIDMLEKKLQYCQKNLTEDKLREDLAKLLEEKHQYQNSAKETMYKLHQDRLEAVHKQISLEKALCTSEDECSLLREQLNKTKQQLQETTVCMDSLKSQYDEKVASSEEQLKAKESEITSLTHKLDHFVDVYAIASSDDEQQHQQQQQQQPHQQIKSSAMSNWLKNSDIKKLEGSEDIIKAICNDTETDISSNEYTSGLTKLQRRINTLEKNFTLLFGADLKADNDPLEEAESESETSECSILTATNDNATTTPLVVGDGDGGVEVSGNGPLEDSGIERKKECDGNQNDVKSSISISSTGSSIASDDGGDSDASNNTISDMTVIQQPQNHVEQEDKEKADGLPAPPYGATPAPTVDPQLNQNVMRRNIRLIKSECMALLRQVEKTMQQKQSEQQTQKAKYEELETELLAFKAELNSRPKLEELERKQQLCDSLTESVSTLRFEVDELRTMNDRCQLEMERMELELLNHKNSENEKLSAFPVPVPADDPAITVECASETEEEPSRKNAPEEDGDRKRTAELSMMPQTLLVVTENAPVAEMPSPVTIPPSVPMVDVETQTEPGRDHVSMGSSTSDLRPVLPLDEPLDVSDGGDSFSSNSCNPELDEYGGGDDGEDDDEKTETIDITTIYNGPTIGGGEAPVSGATPKPAATILPAAPKNGRNGAPSSLLLLASTALAASCDDAGSTLRRSTLVAAAKSPGAAFDHELALINHPDVQREEELIVFKEKYAHLSEENVRLNQQLQRLSGEMNQFRYGSPFQLLMYVIPIVAIIGYLMLNRT